MSGCEVTGLLPVRLNGPETAVNVIGELIAVPVEFRLTSSRTADDWKPVGQPSVVVHVVVVALVPDVGLRITVPMVGSVPTRDGPVAACPSPAVSRPAPAIIPSDPKSRTARGIAVAVRQLARTWRAEPTRSLASPIAADATASTPNSGRTAGEKLKNEPTGRENAVRVCRQRPRRPR